MAEATEKRHSDTTSSVSAMTTRHSPPIGPLGSPAVGPAVAVPAAGEDVVDVVEGGVVVVVVVLGGTVLVVLVLVVELVELVEVVDAGAVVDVLVATAGRVTGAAGGVVAAGSEPATETSAKVAVDAPRAGAPAGGGVPVAGALTVPRLEPVEAAPH